MGRRVKDNYSYTHRTYTMSNKKLMRVPVYAFNGKVYIMPVAYFYDGYPRGRGGACAFCKGDPCNRHSAPDSFISQFYRHSQAANTVATTCPICEGRPT
jgi:hypothetical protein